MSKKSSYKGVRYIATKLTKYFKSQYPNYKQALPKAREVFNELKANNQQVKLDSIFSSVRKKRTTTVKGQAPEIDKKLLEDSYYFELVDYPIYIARTTNQVWFRSKLFPSGVEDIQGGTVIDFNKYFQPYVAYINSIAKLTDADEKRYDTEWLVTCKPPVFNKAKKRWESEIISIDGQGDQFDYGFNQKQPTEKAKDLIISGAEQEKPITPQEPEKIAAQPEKTGKDVQVIEAETKKIEAETKRTLAQTEQKKQENIERLLKLFGEGQLTKMEFKELMSKIK